MKTELHPTTQIALLEETIESLQEQLAVSQAREAKLRGIVDWILGMSDDAAIRNMANSALALPRDDTALREALKAERERCVAKEIEQLRLAEEGAKEAFAHVVQQKRDLEAECKRLRRLLDGAYDTIRRQAPNVELRRGRENG